MLQWAVVTIVSAGAGALVATSFGTKNIWPDISGLALTVLGLSYVASFRNFRAHLHRQMEDEQLRTFLANPGHTKYFNQWHLFVGSFFAIDTVFIIRLTDKAGYPCPVGWIIFLSMVLLVGAIWRTGIAELKDDESA